MKEISDLILKVKQLEEEALLLEEALKNKKNELKHYVEGVLPDIFMRENISKITLDQFNLRLSSTYFVSFKDQKKAIEWFEKQGLNIFKKDLVVHCPDNNYVQLLFEKVPELILTQHEFKISHHWKTMSSQIQDLVEKGTDIPDYIEVTEVNKVYINEVK